MLRNNPYPESGHLHPVSDRSSVGGQSFAMPALHDRNDSFSSNPNSTFHQGAVLDSSRSAAPTFATNPETIHSDAGHSKAFTATTVGGGVSTKDGAGANSTFSSPNQSQQSLTTTLTTIQSRSPSNPVSQQGISITRSSQTGQTTTSASANPGHPMQFSHQYPVTPAPATAIPSYLAPTGNPTTYSGATANNLLSDDASMLTLASSSKRRRRRSMDTDASMRALAPSSVWGGSRESLPLSVLSGNVDYSGSGIHGQREPRPSLSGLIPAERASVYSSQGIAAPALASERNSFYATSQKQTKDKDRDTRSIDGRSMHRDAWDGRSVNFDGKSLYGTESLRGYEGSVRSGAIGNGRTDSISGSIGTPLASPTLSRGMPVIHRRSSEWREDRDEPGVDAATDGTTDR